MVVNPWEVSGEIDYNKLIREFGTSQIDNKLKARLDSLHPLIRRGVYFSHRDLDKWVENAEKKKKVSVITGRGPSEKMHIGHLVPFLIARSLQERYNCNVYIPISDDEKFFIKEDLSFEKAIEFGKENILDIIALGFDANRTFIFQDFIYTDIYRYAAIISKKINYSTAKAIFGLTQEKNLGWTFYPAMQAAHILYPQFIEGAHLSLVPVAIDQDPFIRLTRDVAESRDIGLLKPCAIHAKFIVGLNGSAKMSSSSSEENNVIYLSDTLEKVRKKINKYAFSGGQATIEEHRKKGGNPKIDVCFQYLKIFFEEDDKKLKSIEEDYKNGKLLTSELKEYTIQKISNFLSIHQKNREKAKREIEKYIIKNTTFYDKV
ncbi:MAG: tryptophan--tRNA ligase [Candidatus Pacearchaeota archaeon]